MELLWALLIGAGIIAALVLVIWCVGGWGQGD